MFTMGPRGLMARALDFGYQSSRFSRDCRFESGRGRESDVSDHILFFVLCAFFYHVEDRQYDIVHATIGSRQRETNGRQTNASWWPIDSLINWLSNLCFNTVYIICRYQAHHLGIKRMELIKCSNPNASLSSPLPSLT